MITSVPVSYSVEWIKASIKVAERNYSLCLACGLLVMLINMFVSFIPFLGSIASTVLIFLFYTAQLKFVRRLLNKEEVNFEQFLQTIFDPEIFSKNSPYIVICAISAALASFLVIIDSAATSYYYRQGGILMSLGSVWNVLNFLLATLCAFAVDLRDKNPELSWQAGLRRAFAGVWQNIIPWVLTGLLVSLFAIVSMVLCVLPFFLYFVPMTFPYVYLIYASIFEGLNIEQVADDWRKPVSTLNS